METGMNNKDTLNMTISSVMRKEKYKVVHVRFERQVDGKKHFAEATVPDCEFKKVYGFTEEEIVNLRFYLKEHVQDIFEEAQKINDKEFWLK